MCDYNCADTLASKLVLGDREMRKAAIHKIEALNFALDEVLELLEGHSLADVESIKVFDSLVEDARAGLNFILELDKAHDEYHKKVQNENSNSIYKLRKG